MTSLLSSFASAVERHPQAIAIVNGAGRSMTFAALQDRVDGLAQGWHARGLRRGDRVLLAMPVDIDLYASLAALWSLGATVVLPEPAMGLRGLRHAARVAGVTAICTAGPYDVLPFILPELWGLRSLRPRLRKGAALTLQPAEATDLALISFTSGTTGLPKAIPRSHAFLAAQHHAIAPLLDSNDAERDLVAFPVFVLINLASGRTSVLPNWRMSRLDRLSPDALTRWIASQHVTRALLPPALCATLAQTAMPDALHTVFTGGGPVFPHLLQSLRAAKDNLRIVCVYGSTEAEPIAHLDAAEISECDRVDMIGGAGLLAGRAVADIDLRIVGDEIQVAGPHVNGGYLDKRHDSVNKIHEDGRIWHRTGDAGRLDDAGRLWLLGRTGTQVQGSSGPVYPFTVEVAVMGWAGVRQCCVMARAHGTTLVIEGDRERLPQWQKQAGALGIGSVLHIARIPMDKRHFSKVDRTALARALRK